MQQTEIFPPKYIAMELRKKGYDEPCVGWYEASDESNCTTPRLDGTLSTNSEFTECCIAHTYDQVVGWFASKEIEIKLNGDEFCESYSFQIWTTKKVEDINGSRTITSNGQRYNRQQSLLTAFKEALKLI